VWIVPQAIELMQQSQELLNPPNPDVTCEFDDIMNTMTCR